MKPLHPSRTDARKTKQQLIDEIDQLRRQIKKLSKVASMSGTQLNGSLQAPKIEKGEFEYDQTLFSKVIELASDAIISTDKHSRIKLFNQGAETLVG